MSARIDRVERLLGQVTGSSQFIVARSRLEQKEAERVDRMLRSFVEQFVAPLDELTEIVRSDGTLVEEIRRAMTSPKSRSGSGS